MMCRRVRKLIPLAAGDDLRPGDGARFLAHIERCPACRKELEAFGADLAGIRAAARDEGVEDWSEGEWRAVVARVAAEAKRSAPGRGASPSPERRLSWAVAATAGALFGLVIMGVLIKGTPLRRPVSSGPTIAAGPSRPEQDRVTITMVSPESGLQVVWILDKNFDWKGDHE